MVTTVLSNDATAVVLTPAVYAMMKRAKGDPLPYLFACAFIANAASIVLPISNPANLVMFGNNLPPLLPWLRIFLLPASASILATYLTMRLLFRRTLQGEVPNVLEQDHRAIKRRVRASQHFRSFWGAWRTIAGYEAIHMIRKGQACGSVGLLHHFILGLFAATN